MMRRELLGLSTVAPVAYSLQSICVSQHASLWLFGVDTAGASVAIRVNNFTPRFMLLAPLEIHVGDAEVAEEERERVNQLLGGEDHIESIESVCMTPFVGFTNFRKDHLWTVTCASISTYRRVVKFYKQEGTTMFHEDVGFANQFLQARSLSYQTWISTAGVSWRRSGSGNTACVWEGSTLASRVCVETDQTSIARILQCYVYIQTVSRDGIYEGKTLYTPNADNAYDRVVLAVLSFVGSWSPDPLATTLFTTCPQTPAGDTHTTVCCDDEKGLLEAVREMIIAYDPDDLVYFPVPVDTLRYMATRYQLLTPNLRFDPGRFRSSRPEKMYGEYSQFGVCRTRSVVNIVAAIKRNVGISIESYDLQTLSSHPSLRKDPLQPGPCTEFTTVFTNSCLASGVDGYRQLVRVTLCAVTLLRLLAADSSIRLEFSNISRVSDTAITDTISRGEQVRVYNKLVRFCSEEGFYVNRAQTSSRPLRFSVKERGPSFVDPPEHAVTSQLRTDCTTALERTLRFYAREGSGTTKRKYVQAAVDPFAPIVRPGDDDSGGEEQAEGGNVMRPCPGFWGKKRVAVFDFASLYPSIMQAYNISYETIVFDKQYMDLPGVAYLLVAVNQDETVAIADVGGIITKLLRTLIDARNAIKRRMKHTTDPFRKSMYDKEQNSMKVLCNATYGFCGADGKGAMLAVKTVMYIVTSIGRYLQKQTSEHLAARYAIPSIYGDTDSVFVRVEHGDSDSIAAVVRYTRERYAMGEAFQWATVVHQFQSTVGIDLDTLAVGVQINAVLYMVYQKLCAEVSAIFRPEIVLEMENMCDNVWMGWVKKHYCYRMWDPSHPGRIQKIKITGMPVKKREYTPWVRGVLMALTEKLLYEKGSEIHAYLEGELQSLIDGSISMDQLRISRSYKGVTKYKHFRQPHLQVVRKMESRCRTTVESNSRVFFVVVTGRDKLYLRTETPEYAQQHGLALDYAYYLKHQFYTPVKKLLTYHPEVCDFESLFAKYTQRLLMRDQGVTDVGERSRKHTKVSVDDAVRSRRASTRVPPSTQLVRQPVRDPFARFV